MQRATNDTNVWISGINWRRGKSHRLLKLAQSQAFTHVTSLDILFEITRVLRDYFGYSDETAYEWYRIIGELSVVVRPKVKVDVIQADPTDNKFLECAIEGQASYIVSGDRHLLALGRYEWIEMVTPDQFLRLITAPN